MKKTWDIHGGIHPPENKSQSLQRAISNVPMPDVLILPLNQHIGAPALPLVKPGDTVLKGQMIAEPNGFISAAVHAPTSGTIAAIEERPISHPSGMSAPCIVLHSDGDERWVEGPPPADYQSLSPAQLLTIIRDAGITGMGGAGFPTAVKLQPRQSIDTLIINATECEPYITADDILIRERAEDIVTGIDILAHILGRPEQILIGIEDNKAEAYEALEPLLKDTAIELVEFPTKYPSGGEKQVIQILTGQEVPSGKLPAELGIVCQNVGTVYAIFRAVCKGEPLVSRITTVTGNSCRTPGNYEVLIGTPAVHLLTAAGFDEFLCQRLILGGPMMGYTLNDLSAPVIKSTNCLLAADAAESPQQGIPQACIRCGHCAEVCPAKLLPQQLFWYARSKDYDKLAAYHLGDCIECGACSYVCPSEIPLVQYYRAAKAEIRVMEQENIAADRSRQRFEYHQERLAKAEQEKIAKREARKKAAEQAKLSAQDNENIDTEDTDVVAAALARVRSSKPSPEEEHKRLQRAVMAAESRLAKARANHELCAADDPRRASREATLEQARLRHNEAVEQLTRHTDSNDTSKEQQNHTAEIPARTQHQNQNQNQNQDTVALDRAQLAIEQAQQRAAQQAEMSAQEKLQLQCDSLRKRLAKARDRLKQAESDADDNIEAYATAVTKLEDKLAVRQAEVEQGLAKTPAESDS